MSYSRQGPTKTMDTDPKRQKHDVKPPVKQPQNKRPPPTHFLCFPLVTNASIRQLTASLTYFRSVTTPLQVPDENNTPEPEDKQERTVVEPSVEGQTPDDTHDQKLRLLPESAHRPAGTYHFTLGTMNLSKPEDMDKALALLQEIDYLAILNDVGSGEGILKHARASGGRRADHTTKPKHKEGLGKRTGYPAAERPSDAQIPSADGSTSVTTGDNTQVTTATAKDILTSPIQSLKSLTRAISPPRLSASSYSPPKEVAPISVTLHSLGVFPKASSARAFFANPSDRSNRLQTFAQLVRRRFREAGLITETRPLVLHATVANLIYVKGKGRTGGRGGRGRAKGDDGTVDAREILRFFNGEGNTEGGQKIAPPPKPDSTIALGSTEFDAIKETERRETPDSKTKSPLTIAAHPVPYIWAKDIPITSVRICKMGAERSDKPGWGLEYRPIAEKVFLSNKQEM